MSRSQFFFFFFFLFCFVFSSPEHEVLMVSYCDQSLSVVCRPSSVRCQLFALNDFSSQTARRILK